MTFSHRVYLGGLCDEPADASGDDNKEADIEIVDVRGALNDWVMVPVAWTPLACPNPFWLFDRFALACAIYMLARTRNTHYYLAAR